MCSTDDRVISFIDPGHLFLADAKHHNDVYLFIWSMLMYRLKGARVPLLAEREFLKAYFCTKKPYKINRGFASIIRDIRGIFTLRIDKEHERDNFFKKTIYNAIKGYFIITRAVQVYIIVNKFKG